MINPASTTRPTPCCRSTPSSTTATKGLRRAQLPEGARRHRDRGPAPLRQGPLRPARSTSAAPPVAPASSWRAPSSAWSASTSRRASSRLASGSPRPACCATRCPTRASWSPTTSAGSTPPARDRRPRRVLARRRLQPQGRVHRLRPHPRRQPDRPPVQPAPLPRRRAAAAQARRPAAARLALHLAGRAHQARRSGSAASRRMASRTPPSTGSRTCSPPTSSWCRGRRRCPS